MKKTILTISILFLSIACEKTVINSTDLVKIEGDIEDIVIDEGIGVLRIELDQIYFVKNDKGRIITQRIIDISNPILHSVKINENILEIILNAGEIGSSTIKLRSDSGIVFKVTEFTLTVNLISAQNAMDLAIKNFKEENYELSLSHFKLVTRKDKPEFYSDAFMGQGFSKMRFVTDDGDLGYNDFLQSLIFDNSNVNAIAGLSLLEYTQKKNYSEAIRKGNEVLLKNADFIFVYDSNLDKNDIILNIALSQFSLKDYNACLESIQAIEPGFSANPDATNFSEKLLLKLNALIIIYS